MTQIIPFYEGSSMENILIAVITGGLALMGVIITTISGNKKIENQILASQQVTDTKIEYLSAAVEKHNNFATRIPVIEEHMKSIDNRLDDVEQMANLMMTKRGEKK